MNPTTRDLAIELYQDYKINPEDLSVNTEGFIWDKRDGTLLSPKFLPLTRVTSEEILAWEMENGHMELCDMCEKVECSCDDDYMQVREN